MRRLDGPLATGIILSILVLAALGAELFDLVKRLFRRFGRLGFEGAGSREEQDGYTFV